MLIQGLGSTHCLELRVVVVHMPLITLHARGDKFTPFGFSNAPSIFERLTNFGVLDEVISMGMLNGRS